MWKIMLTALLAAAAGVGAASETAAQVAPKVTVSVVADEVPGGAVFTLELLDMNLPPGDNWISIYVTKDGVQITDSPWGFPVEIPCPVDTASTNDPAITNSCEFLLRAAVESGSYDLEIYIQNPSFPDTYTGTVVLEAANPWWEDYEVVSRQTNIFTGTTDLVLRFNDVPPGVGSVELTALIDTEYDSFPDRVVSAVSCTDDDQNPGGSATCDNRSSPLQALCTADETASQYCDDQSYQYWFAVNDIPIGYTFQAILYRLSRYDEGRFFAEQDYAAGVALQDRIDLDAFVRQTTEECSHINASNCYDDAYYITWLDRYLSEFEALMVRDGQFTIVVDGTAVTVDAAIPRLPIGAHGLSASVEITPDGDAIPTSELNLDCNLTGCNPITANGIAPGAFTVKLKLFNDHPRVTILDDTSEEISWGQDTLAMLTYDATGPIAPVDLDGPVATVDLDGLQAATVNATPVVFSVMFDEAVTGFDNTDITIAGTAGATTGAVAGSGDTYTVTVDTVPNDGTVTVAVAAGAVTDTLANPSTTTVVADTVTVDRTGPILVVPAASIVVGTDPGKATTTVTYTVTATDPDSDIPVGVAAFSGPVTLACSPASGSLFPIGTTGVACTATDSAGNTTRASFDVIIVDNEAPVVSSPGEQVINLPAGSSGPVTYNEATATDNSGSVTVVCTPPSRSTLTAGRTTVSCIATDAAGNTTTASFALTVNASPITELPATGNTSLPIIPATFLIAAGLATLALSRRRLHDHTGDR